MLDLLIVMPPLAAVGMAAAVAGRLRLHRLANGRYRGSFTSWLSYLGGIALVTLAIMAVVTIGIWAAITR